jgi:hypothetical protein
MAGLILKRPGSEHAVRLAAAGEPLDAWAVFRVPDIQTRRECEEAQRDGEREMDGLAEDSDEYIDASIRRGLQLVSVLLVRVEGIYTDDEETDPVELGRKPDGTFDDLTAATLVPMCNVLIETATSLLSLGDIDAAKNLPSPRAVPAASSPTVAA